MPLSEEKYYTSEDYWNLPEGQRAELIDGKLYNMALPDRMHQELVFQLSRIIGNFIESNHGECKIYPAPFAVNLNADNQKWLEPDISIICDRKKLSDRGCEGAPDFIIEVVSPGSRKTDYSTKNALYSDAGVREYWIVDPKKSCTTVYRYEEDAAPTIIPFEQSIQVGIYKNLRITISELIK
ncbi:hypothetical protein BRYFOR_07230 [Marvinbryantia formatexigens DSM 14469]|uniref:Putative restriction endonuclease domain-containing protein n=1 Tax=Marvinbryantia formatexigens DSM 14469 TaxID=478749 RepID=C6LF29_9FIRM|nr:Uma2 family endonuclease [Marvinbryantia formatexigens]EET60768.1 hypothetical protein BRYFOR_07230 [Marvinbryantia formatexigens DSM 14469]UWO26886.1 Uma2 family endonuclease [Marvinbryantia formatexigens DSM 14469]SDG33122.1 Endonuclease, Uma2 family (restriction endonuclease fold) [Marvinbryantia formatexigens]